VRQFVGPKASRPLVWRHWLTFTDSMLRAVQRNVAAMARDVVHSYESPAALTPPPTHGIQCNTCDYSVVCPSFDEDEYPVALMQEYFVRSEHRA